MAAVEYFDGNDWNLASIASVTQSNPVTPDTQISINNGVEYNLGDSDGYIHTSNGSNEITAVWDTDQDLTDTERGDIQVRVKAIDGTDPSGYNESSVFTVDQVNPSSTTIALGSRTSNSLSLNWDSVSDEYFYRYILYYSEVQNEVEAESASIWDQTDDSNLTDIDTENTGINDLEEDTTYYYKMIAYDLFGNRSTTSVVSSKTNALPVISNITATQRTDGSNIIDFAFNVADIDAEDLKLNVLYDLDGGSQEAVTVSDNVVVAGQSTSIGVDNTSNYQIGTSGNYIESSSSNRVVNGQWNSFTDIPGAEDDGYRICIIANDLVEDGTQVCSDTFSVDNTIDITFNSLSVTTRDDDPIITLIWDVDVYETNFASYKIIYGNDESDVDDDEGDITTLDGTDIAALLNVSTRSVDVDGFELGVVYYIKVIAIDENGNISETDVANFEIEMASKTGGGNGGVSTSTFFTETSSSGSGSSGSTDSGGSSQATQEDEDASGNGGEGNNDGEGANASEQSDSSNEGSGESIESVVTEVKIINKIKGKVLSWKTRKSDDLHSSAGEDGEDDSSQSDINEIADDNAWANENIDQFLSFLFAEGSISEDESRGRYIKAPDGADDISLTE